jgi:hypothetical protein
VGPASGLVRAGLPPARVTRPSLRKRFFRHSPSHFPPPPHPPRVLVATTGRERADGHTLPLSSLHSALFTWRGRLLASGARDNSQPFRAIADALLFTHILSHFPPSPALPRVLVATTGRERAEGIITHHAPTPQTPPGVIGGRRRLRAKCARDHSQPCPTDPPHRRFARCARTCK